MKFLDKILRIIRNKPNTVNSTAVSPSEDKASLNLHEPGISIMESHNEYNISEIKKQSTIVKNQQGFLAAIQLIQNFISSTNIGFNDLVSLLKKVIPYMQKEKTIDNQDIISYSETQLSKFKEVNSLDHQTTIADLYSRIDTRKAIQYLENFLGDVGSDSRETIEYFDIIIQLSDFYLNVKEGDKAFQTVRRAGLLVTKYKDKSGYIDKHRILSEKFASICWKGWNNPKYSDYLHYSIVSFILEIANIAAGFPHLSDLFYKKDICFSENWGFRGNENFYKALEVLNVSNRQNEFIQEVYEFAFNELPLKMGIPVKYFKNDVLDTLSNLSEDFDKNYPEWKKIMAAQDKFQKLPFDMSLANGFATRIMEKYCQHKVDES